MYPPCFLGGTTGTLGCSFSSQVTFQNRTRQGSTRDQFHAWSPTLCTRRAHILFLCCRLLYFFPVCVFICTAAYLGLLLKSRIWDSVLRIQLHYWRTGSITLIAVTTMVIIIPVITVSFMIIALLLDYLLSLYFKFSFPSWLSGTDFNCFFTVTYNNRLQKMIQYICNVLWAHMDCIGKNIHGVLMEVVMVRYVLDSPEFCFNTKTPASGWTQTLTREEQCTLEIAGWKCKR